MPHAPPKKLTNVFCLELLAGTAILDISRLELSIEEADELPLIIAASDGAAHEATDVVLAY